MWQEWWPFLKNLAPMTQAAFRTHDDNDGDPSQQLVVGRSVDKGICGWWPISSPGAA